jgi:hypothetical protein
MNLIHEFDAHGWKTFHRLVWISPEGKRVEGTWALFEHPAFISAKELSGDQESSMTPAAGYFALTDYYTAEGSMVAGYSSSSLGSSEPITVTSYELTQAEHEAAQAADGEANDDEFALKA